MSTLVIRNKYRGRLYLYTLNLGIVFIRRPKVYLINFCHHFLANNLFTIVPQLVETVALLKSFSVVTY